jgi:hypothetical protein
VLHSCYHFNARASPFKYLPRASIPSDILIEQGLHIANLSQWLEVLDHDVLAFRPGAVQKLSAKTHSHTLILQAQCLSTTIYASTVLSPDETSYDFYGPRYRQIIGDVAIALGNHQDTNIYLHQRRPGPGIVEPLFLTAIKYRYSTRRRQAVELLRRTGPGRPMGRQTTGSSCY